MTIKHLYPSAWPKVDFNFAATRQLDPRITFTRDSIGTYIDAQRIFRYAAEGEPRFEHDPATGESLGLLIEESRTNEFLFSTLVPENNYWKYQGLSRVSTNEPAPDGSNTAILCTAPDGPGGKTMFRGVDLNGYGLTTFSFYAKAANPGTGQQAVISYFAGEAQNNLTGWVNLDNGNIETISGQKGDAVVNSHYAGNGWWRLELTLTPTGIHSYKWNIGLENLDSAFLWGAQLEEGNFASSYIPTSGAAVDRSEDLVTADLTDDVPDQYTIITKPFGCASGKEDLSIYGYPHVQEVKIYPRYLSQDQINSVAQISDDFWRWRVLGSSFALPSFTTDGQVTVDWSDGTVEVLTKAEHTFTNGAGYHEVGFRLDSGTYFQPTINNNSSHDQKLISTGPVPTSMKVKCNKAFLGCTNLESIDPSLNLTGDNPEGIANRCANLKNFPFSDFSTATSMGSQLGGGNRGGWNGCSSITSFPAIDFPLITDLWQGWANCTSMQTFNATWGSGVTNMQQAFQGCSSLEVMPFRQTQNVTIFTSAWNNCSSLTSFPLIDTSSGDSFQSTWHGCSSLTSFPLIDTSSGVNFSNTFYGCTGLTSFPQLDMSNGQIFYVSGGGGTGGCWYGCSNLVSFPSISFDSATTMRGAWRNCSSLQDFPPNLFDNWTGVPATDCFTITWLGCTSLTATSVENILNSIDTSGQSAPASGVDIRIDYDTGTGTPNVTTAVTNLKSRGWTITLNNVLQ